MWRNEASDREMIGLWFASLIVGVACLSYYVVQWLIRKRRKCFEAFEGTGIPTVPIRSLINGNADEYWKPSTIESIGRWLKEYGDVFGFFIGDTPFVVVKDLDIIEEIFCKEVNNFSERGHLMRLHELQSSFGANVIFSKGNEWKEIRNTMTPFFTPAKLKSLMPCIQDGQQEFLDVLGAHTDAGAEIDINSVCERLTFDIISKTAFGIDTGVQRNPEQPLFQVALAAIPNFMTGFFYNVGQNLFHWTWLLKGFSKVIGMIYTNPLTALSYKAVDVIEFRRQNPQVSLPDMTQILLDNALARRNDTKGKNCVTSKERAPLPKHTMDEISGNCMVIFLAGYDTTRLALTYWFYVMGRYQDIQEKVRREALDAFEKEGKELSMQTLLGLQYANQVINETLRMYPPLVTTCVAGHNANWRDRRMVTRAAEEDFRCGKYLIRNDTSVIVPTYQLHHDPQYWNEPEKFDPERFSPEDKELIHPIVFHPFGLGRRLCIGSRLALVEILSVTMEVLRNFRITLGPSQKLDLELETYAIMSVPKQKVWIRMHRLSDEE